MGRFIDFLKESAIHDQMNSANKIRDPIKRAIAKYVLDPYHSYAVADVIQDAIHEYGNDEPMTIYRGLNFSNKEDYESFIKSVDIGNIKLESISSWSPSKSQASVFAKTKPSFMEFMSSNSWAEISAKSKARERITGYRGVIIKTEISAGVGLDIKKTGYGVESEVILPPGTYNIEIEEIKTFKDTVADSNVNDIVANMEKEDYDKDSDKQKMLDYIMHHHPDEFNVKSKSKIFKLLSIGTFKYTVRRDEKDDWGMIKFPTINIHMSNLDQLEKLSKFFLESDYNSVLRRSKPIFLQMIKDVETAFKPGTVFNWHGEPGVIAELLGCRDQYISMLQRTVGADYRNTTTREYNRKVTDYRAESERIIAILNSMK